MARQENRAIAALTRFATAIATMVPAQVLSLKPDWLDRIARAVGIAYPPSFLFLVGILFIILILIHFSIAVSKLHQMNKKMAQEIALMKNRQGEQRDP